MRLAGVNLASIIILCSYITWKCGHIRGAVTYIMQLSPRYRKNVVDAGSESILPITATSHIIQSIRFFLISRSRHSIGTRCMVTNIPGGARTNKTLFLHFQPNCFLIDILICSWSRQLFELDPLLLLQNFVSGHSSQPLHINHSRLSLRSIWLLSSLLA